MSQLRARPNRQIIALLWAGGLLVLTAFGQLYPLSGYTDRFAWTIGSPLSATFIGAFYGGRASSHGSAPSSPSGIGPLPTRFRAVALPALLLIAIARYPAGRHTPIH